LRGSVIINYQPAARKKIAVDLFETQERKSRGVFDQDAIAEHDGMRPGRALSHGVFL
jgi:hypothetical protein